MNGKIVDIVRTFEKKFRVTFEVDSVDELNGLEGFLNITVKKFSQKRSLTANAYFHVLVGKIADAHKPPISKARAKNMMLEKYGQEEFIDGKRVECLYPECVPLLDREDLHSKIIGYQFIDGEEMIRYAILRGSHTYDSREMSILIDGTVEDAKELGIPTLSENDIKHMEQLWKSNQS